MKKVMILTVLAAALAAVSVQKASAGVVLSASIGVPGVYASGYYPAPPVYNYAPAPAYTYTPTPAYGYYAPPVVTYAPAPVYVAPPVVYRPPVYGAPIIGIRVGAPFHHYHHHGYGW